MSDIITKFLLLGECTDQAEGIKTKGQWGRKHLVENNGVSGYKLHGCEHEIHELLPVLSASYGIAQRREGKSGKAVPIPLTVQLAPTYLPIVELVGNFLGANKFENRINARLYVLSDDPYDDNQITHHFRTLTLTNGYIQSLAYNFGEHDSFSLTLVGTHWRSQYYMPEKSSPVDEALWSSVTEDDTKMKHA